MPVYIVRDPSVPGSPQRYYLGRWSCKDSNSFRQTRAPRWRIEFDPSCSKAWCDTNGKQVTIAHENKLVYLSDSNIGIVFF